MRIWRVYFDLATCTAGLQQPMNRRQTRHVLRTDCNRVGPTRTHSAQSVKMLRGWFVLWILSCLSAFVSSQSTGSANLSILLMVSNSARFNSSEAAVFFDQALERINKEPSLLNGYELNLSGLIDDKVYKYHYVYDCMYKNEIV